MAADDTTFSKQHPRKHGYLHFLMDNIYLTFVGFCFPGDLADMLALFTFHIRFPHASRPLFAETNIVVSHKKQTHPTNASAVL